MRLALRLAWRDALRQRGRSLLVVAMIALPVLGVTAADIVYQTSELTGVEAIDREIGSAEATVRFEGRSVTQLPDPNDGTMSEGRTPAFDEHGVEDIAAALDRPALATVLTRTYGQVAVPGGRSDTQVKEYDAASPLTTGLAHLTAGRWPARPGEVTINGYLVERGLSIGGATEFGDDPVTVVGEAEDASYRGSGYMMAAPGSVHATNDYVEQQWLIDAGPISWTDVRRLNEVGAIVYSRAVITNPPPEDQVDSFLQSVNDQPIDQSVLVVIALIAAMILLEVVLLAGPAFAVGTRRLHRTMALIGVSGGTPRAMRRVVLAQAVVLGSIAAVVGVVGGLVVARLALPLLQPHVGNWFGPYDVPWPHLFAVAALGLVSAVLAAAVPAFLASRLDVVAILSGRRGEPAPSRRAPIVGLVLLALGCAGAISGARAEMGGEVRIAGSAIVAVLGMVMVIPLVLAWVARLGRWLPMSLRYALRDASRHRTRTAPAVAAVAATVAGLTALGIGVTSDEAENRHTYLYSMPVGMGMVSSERPINAAESDAVKRAVAAAAPGATIEPVVGVPYRLGDRNWDVSAGAGCCGYLGAYASVGNTTVAVGERLPISVSRLLGEAAAGADEALAEGRAVVFTDPPVDQNSVRIRATSYPSDGRGKADKRVTTAPAFFVTVPRTHVMTPSMVLPPSVAADLGVPVRTMGFFVDGGLSADVQVDVEEAVAQAVTGASFWVERGYVASDEAVIVQLVLAGLAALLMLAGTLTATFLALADARPDLATLSAVGASPRTRRSVAGAYALVVALLGAVLGAVVGMVPGLAVAVPLTSSQSDGPDGLSGTTSGPFLEVPWTLLGGVVGLLPLLIAGIVWLTARSRLPMTARLP